VYYHRGPDTVSTQYYLCEVRFSKEEIFTVTTDPRAPDTRRKTSVWPLIVLVVVVAVAAWAAYSYFTHSAPLPNFHW
jgi:hypothetical protein